MDLLDEEIDWPQENPIGKKLSIFEENITCPICQDFYNNPQMLRCGHSYCSLCIRRHFDRTLNLISYDVCPSCREKADTFDLRKNVALANLLEKYKDLRKNLHELLLTTVDSAKTDGSTPGSKISTRHTKGIPIVDRVAQYNFHGMSKEKVKKAIADVTKLSSVKLNTDGEKDALERRLRELIHLINAQIGSTNPLTLEEAITTINSNEKALDKESRKRHLLSISTQGEALSKGFQELTQRALEIKKRRCSNESNDSNQESLIENALTMKNSSWRVIVSKELDRPFYYNEELKTGQFKVPEFPSSPCNEALSDSSNHSGSHKKGAMQPSQSALESGLRGEVKDSVCLSLSNNNEENAIKIVDGINSKISSTTVGSSSWACSMCTFLNVTNGPKCEICDSQNPNFNKVTTRRSYRNTPYSPPDFNTAAPKSISKTRTRKS